MNLFENLQMMKENNNAFEIGKNIPVIVALGGGSIDNLKFTIDQMSDNEVEKLNALLSDLSKYKLNDKDVVMVDKGNVNGENQKYYKTVNAALNDAVLLKRHNTELGKSALYNYNGKTFLRIYDDEFGIDVYNLPKELFNELIKTESSNLKESKDVYIKDEDDFYIIHDANTRKELFRAMKDGGANGSTIEDLIKQFGLSIVEKPNGVTKPLNNKEPIVTLTVDGSPFESEEYEDEFMLNIKNNYDLNVTFKDRGDYNSYFIFKGTFSEIKRYFSDTKWDDWYLDWEDNEEIKSKYLQSINSNNDNDWDEFLYED